MMGDPDARCPGDCHSGDFRDFDHYCDAKQITDDEVPAAFGAWMNALNGWDGTMSRVTDIGRDMGN